MPKLFGVDIAAEIHKNVSPGLLPAVLTKTKAGVRVSGDPTAGRVESTTNHSCRGVFEEYKSNQIDGTVVKTGDRKILLIANSISSGTVEPTTDDKINLEDADYQIINMISRDPAAATYLCQVRRL